MDICTTCRREVKKGQRVVKNYVMGDIREGDGFDPLLSDTQYQHANCFDADGPRYDDAGTVIADSRKGYLEIKQVRNAFEREVESGAQVTDAHTTGW
jgi:hypothetical protein